MRRFLAYPLVALGAIGSALAVTSPALAHGYVSQPPSRQALCASGAVPGCGQIQYEPQSVEGVKNLPACDGGLPQFSVLADETRDWPATTVGPEVAFTWVQTARHRTANWEYFIGGTKIATVDGGNAQPGAVVSHQIDLSAFPGRQTVLAVWNIGDTPMAFYSCIDLDIGGGSARKDTPPDSGPPPAVQPAPANADVVTVPPVTAETPPGSEWAAGTAYRTGDEVTYQGKRFQCRQSHTSLTTWEPSIYTLALWLPL